MPDAPVDSWEATMIADIRSHDGAVTIGPLAGQPLLIITSTGARSGQPRRAILTYSRDGDDYVVAGTANGAPTDPAWLHNVRTHPTVTVEAGGRTMSASATVAEGPERDRLWDAHVRTLPWFAEYPAKAGRVIPMVRLTPRAG